MTRSCANSFFNGRHLKITLILCVQYLIDLPVALRANIDYVFALKENVYREKLFKNFFPMAGNLSTFNALMDELTKDYGAIVLDNTANSSKINECIFWYRANIGRKPFKLGHAATWGFSKNRLKPDDDDEEDTAKGKQKLVISVVRSRK